MKDLFKRETINDMLEELKEVYCELYDELLNEGTRTDSYLGQDLVVLNKPKIDVKAEKLIAVAKIIKQLKKHNPKTVR